MCPKRNARRKSCAYPPIERQPDSAVSALDGAAVDVSCLVCDVDHLRFFDLKYGGVEQRPCKHVFVLHGLGDVVDPRHPGWICGSFDLQGAKLGVPHFGEFRLPVEKMQQ